MILFNSRQRKSITTILDNIATATIIGAIVGIFIDSKVDIIDGIILFSISLECIILSMLINVDGEEDDGN